MYSVQTNHEMSYRGEWTDLYPDDGWRTVSSSRAGHQEFQNHEFDKAVKAFELNTSLARMIWPMRLIDSDGVILRYYSPQLDERLPGPQWRLEQRAYALWEAAGKPEGRDKEFWFAAKMEIEGETSNLKQFFNDPKFDAYGDLIVEESCPQ